MERSDLERRVTAILVEHLGVSPADVQPATLLVPEHDDKGRQIHGVSPDLAADSLDVVELAMAIEEEFGIEIADDEATKLNDATVGDLFNHVARWLGEQSDRKEKSNV